MVWIGLGRLQTPGLQGQAYAFPVPFSPLIYVAMVWVLGPVEGEVYTTGSNDSGQLGARGGNEQVVPMRVAALDTHIVTHIACGSTHTVAVTGNYQSCEVYAYVHPSLGFLSKFEEATYFWDVVFVRLALSISPGCSSYFLFFKRLVRSRPGEVLSLDSWDSRQGAWLMACSLES